MEVLIVLIVILVFAGMAAASPLASLAAGDYMSASGKLSASDIAAYAQAAGFTGQDLITAVAIALAESEGGNPNAMGDKSLAPEKGPSVGLWQIDIGTKEHPELAGMDLTDPQTNANAAYSIYAKAGYSFEPWSTFNNGVYAEFVGAAQTGVNS